MRRSVHERHEGREPKPASDLLTGLPTVGARFMAEMIIEAFAGVTREGGVSWREAEVLDGYGSPEECAAARAQDCDESWTDLVNDPDWPPFAWERPWAFLDPIGFRYYLPAAMIRELRGEDLGLELDWQLSRDDGSTLAAERWLLFDDPQCACIDRFGEFMSELRERMHGW